MPRVKPVGDADVKEACTTASHADVVLYRRAVRPCLRVQELQTGARAHSRAHDSDRELPQVPCCR